MIVLLGAGGGGINEGRLSVECPNVVSLPLETANAASINAKSSHVGFGIIDEPIL